MTSSQALMFNLFGPLTDRSEWLATTLTRALGRSEKLVVERVEFEHSPRPLGSFLNDRTLLDVVIWASTSHGPEIIVLEVKLADRFSSRRVRFDQNRRYRDLNDAFPLWHSPLTSLVDTRFNQLARVHALAARIAANQGLDPRRCTVIVLHHPTDAGAPRTADAYRAHLHQRETVRSVPLSEFLDAADSAAAGAGELGMVAELRARYVDLDHSATSFAEASLRDSRFINATTSAG